MFKTLADGFFACWQGIAGVLCSVNEAPFCCSQSLYFVDHSHLRLQQRKKAIARGGRGRGRGRGVGRGRRATGARSEDEDEDEDEDDDEQYLYFEDGYSADLGMYRDLQVMTVLSSGLF